MQIIELVRGNEPLLVAHCIQSPFTITIPSGKKINKLIINNLLTFLLKELQIKLNEQFYKADLVQNSASYMADYAFHII